MTAPAGPPGRDRASADQPAQSEAAIRARLEPQLRAELEPQLRAELEKSVRTQLVDDSARFLSDTAAALLEKANDKSAKSDSGCLGSIGNFLVEFWNSATTATVITVLVGGVFVTYLSGSIQSAIQERQIQSEMAAKERDLQHDIVTAVNTAQLELHKVTLEDQATSGREALDLVGSIVGHTQNYVTSRGPRFAYPEGDTAREQQVRSRIDEQIEAIRQAFNAEQTNWQTRHVGVGILLEYSYYNDPAVISAWKEVVAAVDDYQRFAVDLNPQQHPPSEWKARFWWSKEQPIHDKVKTLKEKMHLARLAGMQNSPDVARIKRLLQDLQPPP